MWNSARQLLVILDKESKTKVFLTFFPMAVASLLELFSVALIIPVIHITILGEVDIAPIKTVLEYFPDINLSNLGNWVAIMFGGFYVLKSLFLLATLYIVTIVIHRVTALYVRKVLEIYIESDLEFHFQNNSAELLRNLSGAVYISMEGVRNCMLVVFESLILITIILFLFFIESQVTLFAAIYLATIALIYYCFFGPVFRFWGRKSLKLEGDRNRWILQSLRGIRDIKINNSKNYVVKKVYEICSQMANYYSKASTGIHVPRLLIETSVVTGFLFVVLFFLTLGKSKGEIVAIIGIFGMAAFRIMPSLNRLLLSASELRRAESYIDIIYKTITQKKVEVPKSEPNESYKTMDFSNKIVLSNISYGYPSSDKHAISNVNLELYKGELIGIVGKSGSGKTTLLDIIMGLLIPTGGQVETDGIDILRNRELWLSKFGFVPQESFLLDDTLLRNIAFGLEDSQIDIHRVRDALDKANLMDLKLKDGLNTSLGEAGARLSGGQKQRITIARALYKDPEIIVLDEPTSALDNFAATAINQTLISLSPHKTVLVAAHKLKTIANFDKIVVMDQGKIMSVGTYEQLSKECKIFIGLQEAEEWTSVG